MEQVTLKIIGIGPGLLMHNPANMKSNSQGVGSKKIPKPEDEAEAAAYRLPGGQLYGPGEGFRSGIIRYACSGRRIARRSARTVVSGALFLTSDVCPLLDANGEPITEYEIDSRRAVVQRQGIVRNRPHIREWQTTVDYEFDTEFVTADIVLELQNIAGKIAGWLDYAPRSKGPFGRYVAEIVG